MSSHKQDYGLPSRILAAFLSPWFLLVAAGVALLTSYYVYYKPRLIHSYKSWPRSPRIYLTFPWSRRRQFRREPIDCLRQARAEMVMSNIYWTDVVRDYGMTTMVTNDALIYQFLATDMKDSLSWDLALRHVWDDLFEKGSPFGKRGQFYYASRWCTINGFSKDKTSLTSRYSNVIETEAARQLADWQGGDLFELADRITAKALMSIVFGHSAHNGRLASILDSLSEGLIREKGRGSRRTNVQLTREFRQAVRAIIQERMADAEGDIGSDDYLRWLLTNSSNVPAGSHADQYASRPSSPSNQGSTRPSTSNHSNGSASGSGHHAEHGEPEAHLMRDLPDHLLVLMLQTRLLCVVGIVWSVYSSATLENSISPDPLLLVRQARKEVLLGSTIIPEKAFVAISPVMERTESSYEPSQMSSKPDSATFFNNGVKRDYSSTTELSNLSAMNSSVDLASDGGYTDGSAFAAAHSRSNSSLSPLLMHHGQLSAGQTTPQLVSNARGQFGSRCFSMAGSTELSELDPRDHESRSAENVPVQDERHFKSKRGSWVRRYPQGHLMSLLVGSVSNLLSVSITVTGSADIRPRYADGRALWLPFPSAQISAIKAPGSGKSLGRVAKPPASLYSVPATAMSRGELTNGHAPSNTSRKSSTSGMI